MRYAMTSAGVFGFGLVLCAVMFWQTQQAELYRDPVQAGAQTQKVWNQWRSMHLSPVGSIHFATLYPAQTRRAMLDPSAVLPWGTQMQVSEIRALRAYAQSCNAPPTQTTNISHPKAWVWHRHLCGHLETLPESFFLQWPWTHPTGQPYTLLAVQHPRIQTPPDWIQKHIKVTHVHALSSLLHAHPTLKKDPALTALSNASPRTLRAFVQKRATALSDQWVWVRISTDRYALYARRDMDSALSRHGWITTDQNPSSSICTARTADLCWQVHASAQPSPYTFVLALIFGVVCLLGLFTTVGWLLYDRIQTQRAQHDQRAFLLRTLTHELRTPTTGLSLSLDPLREDFDALSEPAQDAFLRICSDVGRLQRVLAATARFLTLQRSITHTPPKLAVEPIHDFDTFLHEHLPFPGLLCTCPPQTQPFHTDVTWLSVCLQNLVQNAYIHGEPPVRVVLQRPRANLVRIEIHDARTDLNTTLDTLIEPFHRQDRSKGLGLGLSIVSHIAQLLGGSLSLHTHPHTTFTLELPDLS